MLALYSLNPITGRTISLSLRKGVSARYVALSVAGISTYRIPALDRWIVR